MFRLLGFVSVLCLVAQPSFADDRAKVVGLWRLVSYEVEVQTTGEKAPVMGQHPTGYVNFSADGRVFFILTGEGRTPPKSDQDRVNLLGTLIAYTHVSRRGRQVDHESRRGMEPRMDRYRAGAIIQDRR